MTKTLLVLLRDIIGWRESTGRFGKAQTEAGPSGPHSFPRGRAIKARKFTSRSGVVGSRRTCQVGRVLDQGVLDPAQVSLGFGLSPEFVNGVAAGHRVIKACLADSENQGGYLVAVKE